MVADDSDVRKVPFQGFDVAERRGFQVNDDSKRSMLSGGVAQVVKRLDHMYGMKRVGERVGEHLGYVGIALEQDYVGGFHSSSVLAALLRLLLLPLGAGVIAALRRSGSLLAVERLGLNLAVLLEENFHLAFSFL